MKVNSFIEVLGLIVVATIAIDIVTNRNSAGTITSAGNAFAGSLRAAQGK